MIILKQPSVRKLEKLFRREDFRDKTILHHTGGMFGIGCRVSSKVAIERILKLKNREARQGLIVLLPRLEWFQEMGIHIPDRIFPLLQQYWPGNLTVIFKCHAPGLEHLSVGGKVAFRVPEDEMLRGFIEMLGELLVSTSVNISNLPPENDLNRLKGIYGSWFDYALLPPDKELQYDPQPSTIVEYVSSHEEGNQSGFDELKCLREGSIPFYGVKDSFEMPTILFVCTANICRSPMAEKLFNHYVLADDLHFAGDSCGLLPGGHAISAGSLQLLLEKGITDAQDHVSKQFTPQILSRSRLILTMEERQRDFLRENEPGMAKKIFTLNEYLGEEGDITDPFGAGVDTYRRIFEIIDDRIKRLILKLKPHHAHMENEG